VHAGAIESDLKAAAGAAESRYLPFRTAWLKPTKELISVPGESGVYVVVDSDGSAEDA
jgi:hypothetical protein